MKQCIAFFSFLNIGFLVNAQEAENPGRPSAARWFRQVDIWAESSPNTTPGGGKSKQGIVLLQNWKTCFGPAYRLTTGDEIKNLVIRHREETNVSVHCLVGVKIISERFSKEFSPLVEKYTDMRVQEIYNEEDNYLSVKVLLSENMGKKNFSLFTKMEDMHCGLTSEQVEKTVNTALSNAFSAYSKKYYTDVASAHADILAGLQNFLKTIKGLKADNQEIVVYTTDTEGKRQVKFNGFCFISPEPEMPKLSISFKDNTQRYQKVKAVMLVQFKRSVGSGPEKDEQTWLPLNGGSVELEPNKTVWEVEWKDKFCGGTAWVKILSVPDEKMIKVFSFHIRGKNPSLQQVMDYVSEKGHNSTYWFFSRIIRHESGSGSSNGSEAKQFIKADGKHTYTSDMTTSAGVPLYGTPNGWGLLQLDNKAKMQANAQQCWNWKANVDGGVKVLDEKKKMTIYDLNDEIKEIAHIYLKNPENVTPAKDEVEGKLTFIHSPTEIPGFAGINKYFGSRTNDATHKSFIEANIIKRYNGGQYYFSFVDSENPKRGYWEVNREAVWKDKENNKHSNYYVQDIGNEEE